MYLIIFLLLNFILNSFLITGDNYETSNGIGSQTNESQTIVITAYMVQSEAIMCILIATIIASFSAFHFPAETQSKIWIKIFGTEWGTVSEGRAWTFIAVLIVVTLLLGLLRWIPTNP
jgi:hypothetical protein